MNTEALFPCFGSVFIGYMSSFVDATSAWINVNERLNQHSCSFYFWTILFVPVSLLISELEQGTPKYLTIRFTIRSSTCLENCSFFNVTSWHFSKVIFLCCCHQFLASFRFFSHSFSLKHPLALILAPRFFPSPFVPSLISFWKHLHPHTEIYMKMFSDSFCPSHLFTLLSQGLPVLICLSFFFQATSSLSTFLWL